MHLFLSAFQTYVKIFYINCVFCKLLKMSYKDLFPKKLTSAYYTMDRAGARSEPGFHEMCKKKKFLQNIDSAVIVIYYASPMHHLDPPIPLHRTDFRVLGGFFWSINFEPKECSGLKVVRRLEIFVQKEFHFQ